MRIGVDFIDGDYLESDVMEVTDWKGYVQGFGDEIGVVIHKDDSVRIIPWTAIKQIRLPKNGD